MRFYFVALTETDGEAMALGFANVQELEAWAKKKGYSWEDYAIIEGNMLKHFGDRQLRRSYGPK